MAKLLSKALDRLIWGLFHVGVLAGALMAVLILSSALLRYVVGTPISFSDELAGLLFVTLAFTTFPYVMNRTGHIKLTLLTERLGPVLQRFCRLGASLILLAFATIFIYESWQFTDFSRAIDSRTDVSGLLLWPWMALMPVSLGLCILVEVRAIIWVVRGVEANSGEGFEL